MKSYDNCLFAQPASIWYMFYESVYLKKKPKGKRRKKLQRLLLFMIALK